MATPVRTFLQVVQGAADRMGVRMDGTLTAATTTLLTIGAGNSARYFKSGRTDESDRYIEGVEVYVTSGTVPVPNPNGIAATDISIGTLTPSVTYGTAPDATATFDVYLRDVRSRDLRDAVNQLLRGTFYETMVPLTQVVDGDMESSATSDWTASNATHSKVTGANTLYHGARASRVLATAASGYIQSTTILVDPTNAPTWFVRAVVRADIGTARLIPYDVTNSANITTEDWTNRGWGVIEITFTLPATCEALAFRLQSVADADDTMWDRLIAHPQNAREVNLPDWLVSPRHVRGVFQGVGSDIRPDRTTWQEVPFEILPDMANPNRQWRLVVPDGLSGRPIVFQAIRPHGALAVDADTTFLDREAAELGTAMLACRLMAKRDRQDAPDWTLMAREFKRDYHARRAMLAPGTLSRGG